MAQRLYESGPLVGKPIIEYPKMLYDRAGNYRKVNSEEEHHAAEKKGWLTISALREEQAREKKPAPIEAESPPAMPQEPIRRGPGRPPLRRF